MPVVRFPISLVSLQKKMVPERKDIRAGQLVEFIQKHHQRTGELTEGIVKRILTSSPSHPHGIKIMTEDGLVGRVKAILEDE
jgi:uncharacterized repeat protein (TIGR03833 family)